MHIRGCALGMSVMWGGGGWKYVGVGVGVGVGVCRLTWSSVGRCVIRVRVWAFVWRWWGMCISHNIHTYFVIWRSDGRYPTLRTCSPHSEWQWSRSH